MTAPVLLGMMGMVVDGGLLMVAYRQTQNVADAAAMGAALDKFKGATDDVALATAQSLVTNNGLSATLTLNGGASNALNIPPKDPGNTGSPFKNSGNYVEVMVTQNVNTLFIQVLGINGTQQVTARAVAGYEPVGAGEGAFVLDPTAAPGLAVSSNNSRLVVNGDITVNSQGSGFDQYGNTITGLYAKPAITTPGPNTFPAAIVATTVNSPGGVDILDNIRAYDPAFGPTNWYDPSNTDRPFFAYAPIAPDPLATLATPTIFSPGVPVLPTPGGDVKVNNGQTISILPGIYTSITVDGGTLNMATGIYVIKGGNFTSKNGATINGNPSGGVLLYFTGTTYDPLTGTPDTNDGIATPPVGGIGGGSLNINGGLATLTPLGNTGSPFNGILFYQRRWNTAAAKVTGNSSSVNFSGTLYAKWANFNLAGQGQYNAQFLVGSMSITGGATVTINASGKNLGKANLVFLVE